MQNINWEQGRAKIKAFLSDQDRALVAFALAFVFLLLIWASFARVDRVVRAEGRIVTLGKSQLVQHLEGGIISEILVHEGQLVEAGQILMRVADTRSTAQFGEVKSRIESLIAKIARLEAESEGRDKISFPSSLVDEEIKTIEMNSFEARKSRLNQELSVVQQQIAQRQSELSEVENRLLNLKKEESLAESQKKLIESLLKTESASKLEFLNAQSNLQRITTQMQEVQGSIPRIRASLNEVFAKNSEIKARAKAEATTELTAAKNDLERANLGMVASSDRVSRESVRAVVKGIVNRVVVTSKGAVVRPGDTLLEITPNDGQLLIEARVRPNDRAELRLGLPARVKVGAYDYARFGTLDGVLTEVSADSLAEERGERYFRIQVEVQKRKDWQNKYLLSPGMTVVADIVLGKRTVLDYVLSPLQKTISGVMQEPR